MLIGNDRSRVSQGVLGLSSASWRSRCAKTDDQANTPVECALELLRSGDADKRTAIEVDAATASRRAHRDGAPCSRASKGS